MSVSRVSFAIEQGGLVLPDGPVALVGAPADTDISWLDKADLDVIQTFRPEHDGWARRGVDTKSDAHGPYASVVVTLPRARDLAQARVAQAARLAPNGLIILDGAKTDGIEALAKAVRGKLTIDGQISKAHGKCLWFQSNPALLDWAQGPSRTADGDVTAPGVFSADGADPGSVALAKALPAALKGRIADLGAGWGWLSREILRHSGVTELHLVEAELTALDCARQNIEDPRAQFHWADATVWRTRPPLDCVVTNPPFHSGRKADPALGRAFISAAAGQLASHGTLWMVANRHLPYETTLAEKFVDCREISGDARFKVLMATRPKRTRR